MCSHAKNHSLGATTTCTKADRDTISDSIKKKKSITGNTPWKRKKHPKHHQIITYGSHLQFETHYGQMSQQINNTEFNRTSAHRVTNGRTPLCTSQFD